MAATSAAAALLNGLGSPFLSGGKRSQSLLGAPIGARVGSSAAVAPKRSTVVAAAASKKSWLPGVRGGGNFIDPEWLDGSLPGDYGFDPLGLGKDPAFLKWYREAELIHGRWAMTAVLGIFVGQAYTGIPWFEAGADPGAIAPFSFGTLLGTQLILMGWVESKRWVDFFNPESQSIEWATPWSRTAENFANATGEQGYPGGKFFDPLGFAGTIKDGVYIPDTNKLDRLKLAEIKHARLAMVAMLIFYFEFRSSVVRNTSSKFRQVSQELKRLASLTRKPQHGRFDRTKSAATYALKGLKFISKTDGGAGWAVVEKRFDELTITTNGLLPRALFCECIGMNKESKEFAGELFDALTRRRNIKGDSINKEELREFWEQISDQSFDSRLQAFFDMVDKDADGRITEEEVKEIISLSASANKLSTIQKQADEYAALIMEELDPDNLGYIMIENLETLLLQAPTHPVRGGESKALSQMLSQKLKTTHDHNVIWRSCRAFKYFFLDNWQRIWVLALWIGVMAGLFAYKFVQYKNRAAYEVMGVCVCLAKGAAETLKLNMALILLPVCRNTITWLRNKTKLGVAVPFDDNLNFHKVIAVGIAFGVGIHAISHLTCDFPRLLHADEEKYELMEPFFGEDQPTNYWFFVKGVEGVTGIIMVVLMAIAFTLATPWLRRGRLNLPKSLKKLTGFNAFWYSHHLFVIVYALLIVHGIKLYLTHEWYKKTTWMYLAVPITLYVGERLIRALRSSIKPVQILKVAVYPGNVLALHMSKPQGFKYKSGQYMFVNCAAVSPFEWHPFSITSAPGNDYLSVHIRTLGDWTRQLKTVFSEVCQPPTTGKSGLLRADCIQGENNPDFPRVLIDGPYGAPAQDYKKYDVVLLVGLGIGATPMISIVKDIVNNMKAMEEEETALESSLTTSGSPITTKRKSAGSVSGGSNFKTRRAYFYWVTREQGSFEWFKGVMNEVAELDNNGVIEMHNYCTSVYEEGDARSALITMLQSINHAKNGVDVVSGTRVKSHFAKPNWRNVYKRIALNHTTSRVGVFYCGAPPPVKELRQLASDFSHKTSTKFDFHKENF